MASAHLNGACSSGFSNKELISSLSFDENTPVAARLAEPVFSALKNSGLEMREPISINLLRGLCKTAHDQALEECFSHFGDKRPATGNDMREFCEKHIQVYSSKLLSLLEGDTIRRLPSNRDGLQLSLEQSSQPCLKSILKRILPDPNKTPYASYVQAMLKSRKLLMSPLLPVGLRFWVMVTLFIRLNQNHHKKKRWSIGRIEG